MLLQKLDANRERRARYLQLLRERGVDGVIVVPDTAGLHAEEIRRIREWNIPLVQVDNAVEGAACDYVGCNNRAGARLVAEHLLSLGHRRLGIVAAVPPLSCIRERIDAFQELLRARDLPRAAVAATAEGCDSMAFGRQATHRLLDLPDRPTALFSVSDPGALGVLRAIRERGLGCPRDVAVASFDDDFFAPYLETSLTSVRWPSFEIGRQAARRLIGRIQGEETGPPRQWLLEPELIHRESTLGPAPARAISPAAWDNAGRNL
jgi:LacI family transcriptional regulator